MKTYCGIFWIFSCALVGKRAHKMEPLYLKHRTSDLSWDLIQLLLYFWPNLDLEEKIANAVLSRTHVIMARSRTNEISWKIQFWRLLKKLNFNMPSFFLPKTSEKGLNLISTNRGNPSSDYNDVRTFEKYVSELNHWECNILFSCSYLKTSLENKTSKSSKSNNKWPSNRKKYLKKCSVTNTIHLKNFAVLCLFVS